MAESTLHYYKQINEEDIKMIEIFRILDDMESILKDGKNYLYPAGKILLTAANFWNA